MTRRNGPSPKLVLEALEERTLLSLVPSSIPGIRVEEGFDAEVFATGLNQPLNLVVESTGNLLVGSNCDPACPIVRLSPAGSVIAQSNPIVDPDGVATDSQGRVFVAGDTRIMIANSLNGGADVLFAAGFTNLNNIAISSANRIVVAENDGRIREVTAAGTIVEPPLAFLPPSGNPLGFDGTGRLFAGHLGGDVGSLVRIDGGVTPVTTAPINPARIDFGPGGAFGSEVFVTEERTGRVRSVNEATGVITTFADGLSSPAGLAFNGNNALFVAELTLGRIIRIFPLVVPRIVWENKGSCEIHTLLQPCPPGTDTDNFAAIYGENAALARRIVDRAIADWETVIQDFKFSTPGPLELTITASDLGAPFGLNDDGTAGKASPTGILEGKVKTVSIRLDDDAGVPPDCAISFCDSSGWYFDDRPDDDAEFTELRNEFAATSTRADVMGRLDFYTLVLHEIGHAVGITGGIPDGDKPLLQTGGFLQHLIGDLWSFKRPTNPTVIATLIIDSRGIHTFDRVHPHDLMNPGIDPGERKLISNLDAKILKDAYEYDIPTLPSKINTFFANLDSVSKVLTVNGAPRTSDDTIVIDTSGSLRVRVNDTEEIFDDALVTSISVLAGKGNDTVDASAIAIPVVIDGDAGDDLLRAGAGEDSLYGGTGNDILLGNAGDDLLEGEAGNDLLIGGLGSDVLRGSGGEDILIGDSTTYDSIDEALRAIRNEWTSERDYEIRIANLRDGTGSADPLNGSFFLQPTVTVLTDGAIDTLLGGGLQDWFFFLDLDELPDWKKKEAIN